MFRCELCDNYLPIFQTGRLCPTCYKIRTIIKCYTAKAILSHISSVFLVDIEEDEEETEKDIKELRKKKSESSIGDETYKAPPIKEVIAEMKTRNQKKKHKN
jgi:hypothetical protein